MWVGRSKLRINVRAHSTNQLCPAGLLEWTYGYGCTTVISKALAESNSRHNHQQI